MFGLENLILGSGIKIVGNIVTNLFQNSADERRANTLKDSQNLDAHVKLAELTQRDWVTKVNRAFIYSCITVTFCTITIYSMIHPVETSHLIENTLGLSSKFVSKAKESVVTVDSAGIVFQKCFAIMEAVIGAFIIPSRK